MPFPLLATKLFIPPPRPNRVSRVRLLEKLKGGLQPGCRLILVSAPAGFGKTTLVSEWAQAAARPQIEDAGVGLALAWLSLDEGDNDPARFWQYLSAALQGIDPKLGMEMASALQLPQPPPLDGLIVALINDLTALGRPALLVLDDYHLVESEEIQRTLGFFLDHLPPDLHLALLTRADPPLHLARRRGRGELCEVRAADLRFTAEEIRRFFMETMQVDLPTEDMNALESRTEGWIAGLQMAAIAAQGRADAHDFVSALSGDDRYIADYLVEEVLQRQPKKIRSFLQRTSILARFNASLCDFLLQPDQPSEGEPAPAGSGAILDTLERANLFITPLDNRRTWFRYHHLFAQLLQQNLVQTAGPALLRQLYLRASDWHLQNGYPREAVEYVLNGGVYEAAARLLEDVVGEIFSRGELTVLQHWAEQIPQPVLAKHPRLCAALAWAAISTNHPRQAETLVGLVEQWAGLTVEEFLAMDEAGRQGLRPEILGALLELAVQRTRFVMDRGDFGAISGRYARVLPYLTAGRDGGPFLFNPPSLLRPPMLFMLATAEELQGHVPAAMSGFEEAAGLAQEVGNVHVVTLASGHMGQLQILLGDLVAAEATFRSVLESAARWGGEQASAFFALAHNGLGTLAYERNDLETARLEFERGITLGRLWDSWEALVAAYEGLALVRLASQDVESPSRIVDVLSELGKRSPALSAPVIETACARVWLRLGRLDQVGAWARHSGYHLDGELAPASTEHASLLASLLLAQGEAGRALLLLGDRAAGSAAAGQWGAWIRLQILLALALASQGLRPAGIQRLEEALERGRTSGYLRVFVDAGQPLQDLLVELQANLRDQTLGGYLSRVLEAFPRAPAEPVPLIQPRQPTGEGLVEPLSARELEVLRLLAGGASNAEIARQAYITVNTVKKHVTSIFGKLGVATRLQAVEKARKLGLI